MRGTVANRRSSSQSTAATAAHQELDCLQRPLLSSWLTVAATLFFSATLSTRIAACAAAAPPPLRCKPPLPPPATTRRQRLQRSCGAVGCQDDCDSRS